MIIHDSTSTPDLLLSAEPSSVARNPKFEARNTKQIQISKLETGNATGVSSTYQRITTFGRFGLFPALGIRISCLFRVSGVGFRISSSREAAR